MILVHESMARALLSFSRLRALSWIPSASINSSRFASRGASKGWMGKNHVDRDTVSNRVSRRNHKMSEEELGPEDTEDVEDKLQALVDEGKRRQRTVKYHMLRRQMTQSGAPLRKLTWDAIEQIRYLKREQPHEWTVERLAEGYSVTPDVILRVLRSKFVPPSERKVKQDAKVMAGLSQQVLPSGAGTGQDRLKLHGNRTPAALPPGSRDGAVVPAADQTLMLRGEGSGSLANRGAPVTALPTYPRAGFSKDASMTSSTEEDSSTNTNPTEEDEESWDGGVMTEEELQDFIEMKRPSPVVQVGKDFFDAEGNFLYRI